MKIIGSYDNGTIKADVVLNYLDTSLIKSVGEYVIYRIDEPIKIFTGSKFYEVDTGMHVVIDRDKNIAYPFDVPFYPADQEEGYPEQKYPESPDDILGLVESFGVSGLYHEGEEPVELANANRRRNR